MKRWILSLIIISLMFFSSTGLAKFDFSWLIQGSSLSEDQIIEGLKEALKVGTTNAVDLTGRVDGYFKNETIKILMPEKLIKVESWLRKIGYGKKVDEFILSMNRAAERAAPAAREIFWGSIKEMNFEDAKKIWKGNDTAATDYFKTKTSAKLSAAFLPAVAKATDDVGVTKKYKDLANKIQKVKFLKVELVDIDQYVVSKSLDGLFYMVGEEERKIRKDPAARITEILKKVFGK